MINSEAEDLDRMLTGTAKRKTERREFSMSLLSWGKARGVSCLWSHCDSRHRRSEVDWFVGRRKRFFSLLGSWIFIGGYYQGDSSAWRDSLELGENPGQSAVPGFT